MFENLNITVARYEEIASKLYDPGVISDQALYKSLMKEYKALTPIVEAFQEYRKAVKNEADLKDLIRNSQDPELREIAEEEYKTSQDQICRLADHLKFLLLPKDPNDEKNVFVEIRGGAGGDEAALFVNSLFRMYSMYAVSVNWKCEIINANPTELGGFKEICFMIEGEGAYSKLKYESGVHRVQRVPETEASGRIHTSTVTVAVLPEAEDIELEINPSDLQIDTYRASGAGGQHVNKTESAIRITHLPTGIIVECQDERSQYKNKDKAMRILRSRILEQLQSEQNQQIASERKSQVGSGDRSERIRTYNYPQSRVTDHRINLTLYRLEAILNGDLTELIDALSTADRTEKLNSMHQ